MLKNQQPVDDGYAQRATAASFTDNNPHNRHLQVRHFTQIAGDRLGNVAFL